MAQNPTNAMHKNGMAMIKNRFMIIYLLNSSDLSKSEYS